MKKVKEIVGKRVKELSEAVSRLVKERTEYVKRVENIDTKLTQLAGAIHEFNRLLADLEEKNEGTDSKED